MRRRLPMLLALSWLLAATGTAPADQAGDYERIRTDWERDGTITPCAYSEQELENAKAVAASNPDDAYTDFPAQLDRELARRRSGACGGRTPESLRRRSVLRDIRIVRVSGTGDARRESVLIRNTGRRTVSLRGATLRNRTGARARFPPEMRLARGRSARVRVGCAAGYRSASVEGRTAWLCRRRPLLRDSGDVARLADRGGIVVSQRGFGRYRRVPAF
jgi:hypothetical protein